MKTKYDYIFFDVANTLLHKPALFNNIVKAFADNDVLVDANALAEKHKWLSEVIKFPDKTSQEFYNYFNTELCMSLGVIPTAKIVNDIFESCTYLPWKPFDDCAALLDLECPLGIISNWDNKLENVLNKHFNLNFQHIIGSAYEGISKPDNRIFENAWNKIGKDKENILFVGDSIKLDMIPALEIGWDVLLIDRRKIYENFPFRIDSLFDLKK